MDLKLFKLIKQIVLEMKNGKYLLTYAYKVKKENALKRGQAFPPNVSKSTASMN